ncbi:hypothetical protein GF386_05270 [Candidatus Pacearchaeota archaeon]|nr:hypothetical protein [Candidatus Pacearchaeota archaeon]
MKLPDKKDIKIFEGGTAKEMLKQCLNKGYIPANLETVKKLRDEKKIPYKWYDTSTIDIAGKRRDATLEELNNIEELYVKGGCLMFAGGYYISLGGSSSLSSSGRFVGVKNKMNEKQKEKEDKEFFQFISSEWNALQKEFVLDHIGAFYDYAKRMFKKELEEKDV